MRPRPVLALLALAAAACGGATPAPAPGASPVPAGGAPCFPDRSVLDAAAVYAALDLVGEAPVPELRCFANGPDQARCSFDRAEGEETDATAYVVAGSVGDGVRGEAAVAFFAPRPVVEIDHSVWCH